MKPQSTSEFSTEWRQGGLVSICKDIYEGLLRLRLITIDSHVHLRRVGTDHGRSVAARYATVGLVADPLAPRCSMEYRQLVLTRSRPDFAGHGLNDVLERPPSPFSGSSRSSAAAASEKNEHEERQQVSLYYKSYLLTVASSCIVADTASPEKLLHGRRARVPAG